MTVRPKFNVVLKISASPANTRSCAHDWWHGDTYWQQLPFWQKLFVGKLMLLSYSSVPSHKILLTTDFFFFFAQSSTNNTQCFLPIQTLACTKILNGDQTCMHSGLQFTSGNYFEMAKLHSYHCPRKGFLKVALAPIYEHSPPHRLGKALRAD